MASKRLRAEVSTIRAAFAKSGLLRLVAHRDMGTHLRRMFQRANIPMKYSQGFSPKPRFHFSPPLPLGVTCKEDWLDIDLEAPLPAEEFLQRVRAETLPNLDWVHAYQIQKGTPPLHELLEYGEWIFSPYDAEEAAPVVATLLEAANGESLVMRKKNKKGKIRERDVRPRIKLAEASGSGLKLILGASANAGEGPLGLFDFLRTALPDLENHPMTLFQIERTRFLRELEDGSFVSAIAPGGSTGVEQAESQNSEVA